MNFLKLISILFVAATVVSCSFDKPKVVRHLTKDFNLGWWSEPRYQALFLKTDPDEYGGAKIIAETVYAVGYNDNFIIVKQHPNKLVEVVDKLFNKKIGDSWVIENLEDTVYLNSDLVHFKDGNWLYKGNESDLDNLFPYKDETFFYIVDIRDYQYRFWRNDKNIYKLTSEEEFENMRKELNISNELVFTIINPDLK